MLLLHLCIRLHEPLSNEYLIVGKQVADFHQTSA